MRKGKYQSSTRAGFLGRPLALVLAVIMLVGASIGGTIAWLTATSGPVTNTFTVGDIEITLEEHAYDPDDTDEIDEANKDKVDNDNEYPLIPGTTYFKDPVVTVKGESEDCYLFVKFEEINNPATYLIYTSLLGKDGEGWTKLTGVTDVNNVWYRTVSKSDEDQPFHLLEDDKVAVKTTVVKSGTNKEGYQDMPTARPQLKYTAYAIQFANMENVQQAWAEVSK